MRPYFPTYAPTIVLIDIGAYIVGEFGNEMFFFLPRSCMCLIEVILVKQWMWSLLAMAWLVESLTGTLNFQIRKTGQHGRPTEGRKIGGASAQ